MVKMVRFHCRAAGDFDMFEEVALRLLHAMGHSGTVPSAILPEDIPQALASLREALGQEAEPQESDDEAEQRVSIGARAYPLIKMLEAAEAEQVEVMWD